MKNYLEKVNGEEDIEDIEEGVINQDQKLNIKWEKLRKVNLIISNKLSFLFRVIRSHEKK